MEFYIYIWVMITVECEDSERSGATSPAHNVAQANNFIGFCEELNLDIKCWLEFVFTPFFGKNFVSQSCQNRQRGLPFIIL